MSIEQPDTVFSLNSPERRKSEGISKLIHQLDALTNELGICIDAQMLEIRSIDPLKCTQDVKARLAADYRKIASTQITNSSETFLGINLTCLSLKIQFGEGTLPINELYDISD